MLDVALGQQLGDLVHGLVWVILVGLFLGDATRLSGGELRLHLSLCLLKSMRTQLKHVLRNQRRPLRLLGGVSWFVNSTGLSRAKRIIYFVDS